VLFIGFAMKHWVHGLAAAIAVAGAHAADTGSYLKFDVGPNYMGEAQQEFTTMSFDRDQDTSFGVRGSVAEGIVVNRFLSIEVEAGALWNELDQPIDWMLQVPLLANLVLRYECRAGWTAFVGIGGGAAAVIANTSAFNEQDNDFAIVPAWQGTAGINYSVNAGVSIGVVYKYLGLGTAKFEFEAVGVQQDLKLKDVHNHYAGVQFNYSF
jgi:opacity protein-like surface antigen